MTRIDTAFEWINSLQHKSVIIAELESALEDLRRERAESDKDMAGAIEDELMAMAQAAATAALGVLSRCARWQEVFTCKESSLQLFRVELLKQLVLVAICFGSQSVHCTGGKCCLCYAALPGAFAVSNQRWGIASDFMSDATRDAAFHCRGGSSAEASTAADAAAAEAEAYQQNASAPVELDEFGRNVNLQVKCTEVTGQYCC